MVLSLDTVGDFRRLLAKGVNDETYNEVLALIDKGHDMKDFKKVFNMIPWVERKNMANLLNFDTLNDGLFAVDMFPLLAQDNKWGVRFSIAKNPNCPTSILDGFMNDERQQVIHAALTNPNVSSKMLASSFGKEKKWHGPGTVPINIISHPNLSIDDVIEIFRTHPKHILEAYKVEEELFTAREEECFEWFSKLLDEEPETIKIYPKEWLHKLLVNE